MSNAATTTRRRKRKTAVHVLALRSYVTHGRDADELLAADGNRYTIHHLTEISEEVRILFIDRQGIERTVHVPAYASDWNTINVYRYAK